MKNKEVDLLEVIEQIRKLDNQLESQTIAVFFAVCEHEGKEGMSMQDLASLLHIAQSSISRNVYKLSQVNRHRVTGLGLVESYEDPLERRRKLVTTTLKGRKLYTKLSSLVK